MSKKILRALLGIVMFAGICLALWPLGQSVYASWNQKQLQAEWLERRTPNAERPTSKKKAQPNTRRSKLDVRRSTFKPLPPTRLVIPDADVDVVVLSGWDESTLKKAPGHWPSSALPGQSGNCAIAGHRNVYGSPFYKVDSLQPGASIELRTPDATYQYRVIQVIAAADSDMTVLQPPSGPNTTPLLTLVTCTIPRTSSRIIVSASLETSS